MTGLGRVSIVPPAASIFSRAVRDTRWARTVSGCSMSPSARMTIGFLSDLMISLLAQRLRANLRTRRQIHQTRQINRLILHPEEILEPALVRQSLDE